MGPARYEVIIEGPLDPRWAAWFDDLALDVLPNGQVCLNGDLPDQPALHGVLERIRDLNLVIVSVRRTETMI